MVLRSGEGSARSQGAEVRLELVNRFQTAAMISSKDKKKTSSLLRAPYVSMISGTLKIPSDWRGFVVLSPSKWKCRIQGRVVPILSPEMMQKRFLPRHFATKEYIRLMRFRFTAKGKGAGLFRGISCLPGETVFFRFFIPRPDFTERKAVFFLYLERDRGTVALRVPLLLKLKKTIP